MPNHGNDIRNLSYEEFGKLRFLDFFCKTNEYFRDDLGAVEVFSIGLACCEGLGTFTFFARPVNSTQTAVIKLDFEECCPEKEGNGFLKWLGLPIQKGMPYARVKEALGVPVEDLGEPSRNSGVTEVRYVVGSTWPYYIQCLITEDAGLSRVWIFRKDLVDRFLSWESRL